MKTLVAELDRERRLGCEYEMTMMRLGSGTGRDVQRSLAEALTANGIRAIARDYQHTPILDADIAVEYDSSVRGESEYRGIAWFPIEIKTRILNGIDDWELIVPRTLEIARYMGARVNRSCGHHVHMSFPEAQQDPRYIRSLYNLIHRFENVIREGLVSASRRNNGYAAPIGRPAGLLKGANAMRTVRSRLRTWERTCGLNLVHIYDADPHVEFRWHGGTLDVAKARHWMRLMNRFVSHAVTRNCQAASEQTTNDRKGFETFRYTIGLKSNAKIYAKVSPELKETSRYLLKRWKRFSQISSDDAANESDE